MRDRIYKSAIWFGNAVLWLWTGAKAAVDWLGRSAVKEDTERAQGMIERALEWLFVTPWWVPAILALALTGFLIFLALRTSPQPIPDKSGPISNNPASQLVDVRDKIFRDDVVILDGKRYISCTFIRCTIQWDGGDFDVVDPKWEGGYSFSSTNTFVIRTMRTLSWLKLIRPDAAISGAKQSPTTDNS